MYSNSYIYNIPQYQRNMYYRNVNSNDQRLFGGAFLAPFLLGGVAGYALGRPNYYYYPQPYYYYPYPTYYNNYYNYNPYY